MPPIIYLTAVAMVTYSFEIVFGLGGTMLLLPIMRVSFDAKTLVMYSAMPQILVGAIGLARSPTKVDPRFLGPMLAYAAAGATVGTLIFYRLPPGLFQRLLGAMVIFAGASLVTASSRSRIGCRNAHGLDVLAGLSQALFGISGPIAMVRLLGTRDDKASVRSHAFAFFLALNIVRLAGYAAYGTLTGATIRLMLLSAPFLALVLWHTDRLHLRVSEAWFRRVVAWVIVAGGFSLFFNG
ncbi:MAG: TSUP family transporter [Acidiferrobacteraceae bacterium]